MVGNCSGFKIAPALKENRVQLDVRNLAMEGHKGDGD